MSDIPIRDRTSDADSDAKPRLPANTEAVGLVLDRNHADVAKRIAALMKNRDARGTVKLWLSQIDRFEFAVVAGPVGRPGVVGGCAKDWAGAVALFRLALARLNELGERRGFSSLWLFAVDKPHEAELRSISAVLQPTEGTA